jgi:hypothetical protein
MKILGLILDEDLKFELHFDYISKKLSQRVAILSTIRHFVPKFASLLIFNSIVFLVYNYAITVWDFTYKIHINSIVKLQRRAVRYVF